MKQPFWKRCLSYFTEIHIESAPSELNPHLYISLRHGRYQLSTANAIYSYGDLYDNFVGVFKKLNWNKRAVDEVLILGFGTGSIPYMLEKIWDKKFKYTAVEKDENVLYLANKYTVPDMKSNISFIPADAEHFVEMTQSKYDMICMDIFVDDTIPDVFKEKEFLRKLKGLLNDDGVLLYNTLASNPSDITQSTTFFNEEYLKVFPDGIKLEVGENFMLVNDSTWILS